jgi:hypothetical protein
VRHGVQRVAEEIAAQGAEHLSVDDKAIIDALADYLDRASYQTEKLRKQMRRG